VKTEQSNLQIVIVGENNGPWISYKHRINVRDGKSLGTSRTLEYFTTLVNKCHIRNNNLSETAKYATASHAVDEFPDVASFSSLSVTMLELYFSTVC